MPQDIQLPEGKAIRTAAQSLITLTDDDRHDLTSRLRNEVVELALQGKYHNVRAIAYSDGQGITHPVKVATAQFLVAYARQFVMKVR